MHLVTHFLAGIAWGAVWTYFGYKLNIVPSVFFFMVLFLGSIVTSFLVALVIGR